MAAVPDRNSASCSRMLVAVAAASPDTISRPPTNRANVLVSVVINQQRPAVLALKSGDPSAIRSIITAVLILVSPHARNGIQSAGSAGVVGQRPSGPKSGASTMPCRDAISQKTEEHTSEL